LNVNPLSSTAVRTILIVDDESEILRLTETILTGQGFEVVMSRGAETAIKSFIKMSRKPDLVLTDVVMPGMSGPMLVDRLLAVSPSLRVLFMSGYDERQIVQKYVVDKGFALLPKPFTPARLVDAVKTALTAPLSPKWPGNGDSA
jgi:two-component system, cell cycle sensor histidine kinase and response regulator CckA